MSLTSSKTTVLRDLIPVVAERTTPAVAGFAVTTPITGMGQYTSYTIIADLLGATGGTLDVLLEHSPDGTNFYEHNRYVQLASGAAAISYSVVKFPTSQAILVVGKNLTTTTAITSNLSITAPLFDIWRVRFIAGAGTSAGALQSIRALCQIGSLV